MKKNQEFELICTDLSDQGFGIGHLHGMTIFVSDMLPMEKAAVRIIKAEKTYAIARVMKYIYQCDERVKPLCDKAGRCGGCALMNLDYSSQLHYKHKQLVDLFSKVNPRIEVKPVLGMKDPYYYRNKAQFPIGVVDDHVVGGFYKARTNQIVPITECKIQSHEINEVYAWLLEHLSIEQAEPLRHLLIRHSRRTGELQVVLIGRENAELEPLSEELVRAFPAIKSVVFNENTRNDNVIIGDKYEVLYGSDCIREKCLDLEIQLHFKSFFQVNPQQMEVLYTQALNMAELNKSDQVIELYSGTGTIGLLAARQAGHVTGVEIVEDAVRNARENQKRNGIENAQFICMDATKFAHENQNQADVVLVDPPRKGMTRQGIEDICALSPQRIVYISCNPRTLARDLQEFQSRGYICPVIQPVDMFAHTTGVESVALLVHQND